jgi:hypothetical protein
MRLLHEKDLTYVAKMSTEKPIGVVVSVCPAMAGGGGEHAAQKVRSFVTYLSIVRKLRGGEELGLHYQRPAVFSNRAATGVNTENPNKKANLRISASLNPAFFLSVHRDRTSRPKIDGYERASLIPNNSCLSRIAYGYCT